MSERDERRNLQPARGQDPRTADEAAPRASFIRLAVDGLTWIALIALTLVAIIAVLAALYYFTIDE